MVANKAKKYLEKVKQTLKTVFDCSKF